MDRTTSDWGKRLNSSEMLVEIDGGSNWFRNVMETVTKEIKVLVVTSPAIHMETNRSDFQYTSCVDNLRWATRAFDSYALYHDQADKKNWIFTSTISFDLCIHRNPVLRSRNRHVMNKLSRRRHSILTYPTCTLHYSNLP